MKMNNPKKLMAGMLLALVMTSAVGCVVPYRPYSYEPYRRDDYVRPYYPYRYYWNRDAYRWHHERDRWDRD